jgi:hypothetical protein
MNCGLLEMASGMGLITVLFLVVVGVVLFARFTGNLRTHHPDAWRSLGSPSAVVSEGAPADKLTFTFIMQAKYRQLGDCSLTKLGDGIRVLLLLVAILLACVVVAYANMPHVRFAGIECLFPI